LSDVPNITLHIGYHSDIIFSFPSPFSYNPSSGEGALGVEFAGTSVTSTSPFGANIGPAASNAISSALLASRGNEALQWSEASYRGFFTLTLDPYWANATYYAMKNISQYFHILHPSIEKASFLCPTVLLTLPFMDHALIQLMRIWTRS
jgi:hypothetical protein